MFRACAGWILVVGLTCTTWNLARSASQQRTGNQALIDGDTTILLRDTARLDSENKNPAPPLTAEALQALWADLAGEDAARAYQAIWKLAASPEQAVPFLTKQLRPVPAADPKRLARLIVELDDPRFAVRNKAMQELEQIGELAEPALSKVLEGKPSLEVRQRVEQLLAKTGQGPAPGQLRMLRALEALEHMATPAAEQLIGSLAQGAPGAKVTQDATASLKRLAKRR